MRGFVPPSRAPAIGSVSGAAPRERPGEAARERSSERAASRTLLVDGHCVVVVVVVAVALELPWQPLPPVVLELLRQALPPAQGLARDQDLLLRSPPTQTLVLIDNTNERISPPLWR